MNSRFEKVLRGSLFAALVALFLMLPGCPLVQGDGLVEGSAYDVEVQVLEDGTLYAVSIEPSDDGEQDGEQDGENEEQEGENDADSDGDSDSDSDEEEDGENEGEDGENEDEDGENEDEDGEGDEVETGFSVQVDSVAADCSSFTVFGSLMVVLEEDEDDGENEEEEGENDDEGRDELVTMVSKGDVSQDPADVDLTQAEGEQQEDGEGDDEGLGICDLTAGMWIEVEGEYGADGVFVAEEIEIADEAETEIESVIGDLTAGTFTMLGLTITYDENTVIEAGEEDGENEDGEDDGEECEQEGENEGENAGC